MSLREHHPQSCCCCSLCFCFEKEEKTPKFRDVRYKLIPPPLPSLASDKTFALPQPKANTAALVQGHQVIQESKFSRSMSFDVQSSQEASQIRGAVSQQPRRATIIAGRAQSMSPTVPSRLLLSRQVPMELLESPSGRFSPSYATGISRQPSLSQLWSPPSKFAIPRSYSLETLKSPEHSAHRKIIRQESFLGEGEETRGLQAAHFARRVPKLYFSLYYDVQRRALTIGLIKAEKLPPKPRGAACNPFVMIYIMPHKHGVQQSEIKQGTLNPVFSQGFEFCDLQLNEVKNQVLVFVINDNEM